MAVRIARVGAGGFMIVLICLIAGSSYGEPIHLQPIVSLKGHQNAIYSVAFSPDGALIATGSFDQSVRLWEAKTGKELRSMTGANGHQGLVLNVAFAPNGETLATGGADNTARIWDIPPAAPLREFVATARANAVTISPDGKLAAAACRDGSIQLWTTNDGKPAGSLIGHPGGATGVSFSANGQLLASSGADGTVRSWNPANGQPIAQIGAHTGPATSVVANPLNNVVYSVGEDGFLKWWQAPGLPPRPLPAHAGAVTALFLSADGNNLLTAGADHVVKWSNTSNGQLVREFQGAGANLHALALSPNSTTIAGAGADGKLYIWKSDDGKLLAQLPAHRGGVNGVSFHPSQPILTTVGADGLLKNWSLPINSQRTVAMPDRVVATTLSNDGKRLYTSGPDKIIRAWTVATGALERQFAGHALPVTALTTNGDGSLLVSASADETIRFWNVANGAQSGQISGHEGPIHSLAFAQGNVLISGGEDGAVKLWQVPPVAVKPFVHSDAVLALALAGDGNRFVSVGNDKQVRTWNLSSGQTERSFGFGSAVFSAAACSADLNTVAVAGTDKTLSVWIAGKETQKWPALPAVAQALAFAPKTPTLAVGLADHSIRLFNIADAKETKNVQGHTGPIAALTYSSNGDLLVSGSADKTVRLWNAADGAPKGQLNHTASVTALAINKDAGRLAAGAADKTVALWTLPDGKLAATIRTPAEIRGLAFHPDGQKLAVAGSDGKVRIFAGDGKLLETFVHEGAATAVAFLPDGKRLLSASADKTVRLWTPAFLAQGKQVGPVRHLFSSPQSDRAFSVSDDKHLRLWDARGGAELKAILAHDSPIVALSMSADLRKGLTAGTDKTVKVWNVADGNVAATMTVQGLPQTAALSPDGTRVAVAFADQRNHLVIYDAVSGAELQTLPEPAAAIRSLQFLADNRTLVSAGDDKAATIQQTAVQRVLTVNGGGAVAAAYNPAGTQILTAGSDKMARLWDMATGKEVKSYGTLADSISALSVSRDFTQVAAAAGKSLKIWQIADGKELATIAHPADVLSIAFNADHTRVISGAADHLVRVWEVATGRLLQTFGHGGPVTGVAFHPVQPLVIAASADKTVVVHALGLTRLVAASPLPLRCVAETPNGTHVITAGDDKIVKAWNANSGADERTFADAEGPVHAVAVSKNSTLIATGGADQKIRLYTLSDGKLIGTIAAPAVVRGLAFHPTLPILSAACADKSAHCWNIAMQVGQPLPPDFGKLIQSLPDRESVVGIAISERGELFAAGAEKSIKQWRIASDAPVRTFQHPGLVDCVAFDPSGKQLATGCHDGLLRIFDIEKNAAVKTITAHTQTQPEQRAFPIYSVSWAPDGKQVLTASYDRSMKLWDVSSGNMVREFKPFAEMTFPKGHRDQIFCAVFTKDAKMVATGSSDKMIKLWNVADGTVIREFANPKIKQMAPPESPEAHPGWVYALRFSADEKHLFSAGSMAKNRGYLAVWNVADGKMLYGEETDNGPIYSLALSTDGSQLLLGCGPADRQVPASEGIVIPAPVK